MTPIFICGFECGLTDPSAHIGGSAGTGLFEISTSIVRGSSSRSGRILVANQTARINVNADAQEITVGRVYVRFETLPDSDIYFIHCGLTDDQILGIAFKASTGKVHCAAKGAAFVSTPIFFGSGSSVSTGVWYRIDFKIVQTAGAKTVDAKITEDDGEENVVTLTQATSNDVGVPEPLYLGSRLNSTGEWFYDDLVLSATAGDYPIGAGYIAHFVPVADGSHNITGADDFERGDTGTDITNGTTTAYQLVDDVPMPSASSDSDSIRATAAASSGDYVEVKFGPAPGIPTPTVGPRAIDVIVAYHQETSVGNGNVRFALNDNGSLDDVENVTKAGSNLIQYGRKLYSNPPSAASVWNANGDGGDGDFRDLRMRMYSSDSDPDQYWDSVMIEAEFPALEPAPPPGGYYACAGTLPTFDTADADKIDELQVLRGGGSKIEGPFELVKIDWPDGAVYYSVLQTDDVASVAPPVSPIQVRLIPENSPAWFLPAVVDASIGDEEVDLAFWDADGIFSDLLYEHGEGVKVELFYWFPQVELLLPHWHGHLRQEDDADRDVCKVKAVQGFRSSEGLLPRRAHYRECQAIFGGVFATQEEIDEHRDCPYNRHIGGSVGNYITGTTPYTSCPRRTRADCIARLSAGGNYMLSHATTSITVPNNQTEGDRLFSTSRGNESNLSDPVRVVMGSRRVWGMPPLAYREDENNNDPDRGFIFAIYEACEGPIQGMQWPYINLGGETESADPANFTYRLGEVGQTTVDSALTPHSYSGTALMRVRSGWVDPTTVDTPSTTASVLVHGLRDLRVYTDETTYTEEFTDNRAWQIMRMLTDKRWGYGYDYDRLDIPSFIEAACWCANVVRFTDDNGDEWDHVRALSHIELRGRKVQQQIEDVCMSGRLSRPFLFNGKIHIVPLRAMTSAELAAAPVFTDEGPNRNIVHEKTKKGWKTTLKRSRTSDLDLPNRIECTFADSTENWVERPLRAVEDVDAQLRAGVVLGDYSKKINVKKYGLAGVVVEGQGLKVATSLRDLGPFDEGGLVNNLRLKFKIWFIDSLDLFPTKVIKVQSSQIDRYGFDHFRVVKMKRLPNLHVEVTVQAYNQTYMDAFEELYGGIDPIPDDPPPVEGPAVDPPTDPLIFGSVSFTSGVLQIENFATV